MILTQKDYITIAMLNCMLFLTFVYILDGNSTMSIECLVPFSKFAQNVKVEGTMCCKFASLNLALVLNCLFAINTEILAQLFKFICLQNMIYICSLTICQPTASVGLAQWLLLSLHSTALVSVCSGQWPFSGC